MPEVRLIGEDGKQIGIVPTDEALSYAQEPDTRAAKQSKASKDALGLSLQPHTPAEARERGLGDRTGVLVRGVQDGSPAANAGLKPLHGQARLLASRIGRVSYEHVPREMNKEADRLANIAMDEAAKHHEVEN